MLRMKNILLSLLAMALATSVAEAKLNVVATTADLGSIARVIGGDRIELSVLAAPTDDPHAVAPKPEFITALNQADVLIEGGAGLETGWLPALLDKAQNSKIAPGTPGHITCARGIQLINPPEIVDHSHGIHAAGNPHYAIAPSNAKIVAWNIARGLVANDPKSADYYQANLKKFDDAIDTKLVEWRKALAPFRGRNLVAYHDAWEYFAREFGLNIDLFLEPAPGVPPNAAHLDEVIAKMKEEHANIILMDSYLDRAAAVMVARKTNSFVVDVSQFPGGIRGTDDGYIQLEDRLVAMLVHDLYGYT
jgi:zinc/manganese transport system substrate-binding protein